MVEFVCVRGFRGEGVPFPRCGRDEGGFVGVCGYSVGEPLQQGFIFDVVPGAVENVNGLQFCGQGCGDRLKRQLVGGCGGPVLQPGTHMPCVCLHLFHGVQVRVGV